MKRVLCALLAIVLLAALGACGAEKQEPVTELEKAVTEEITAEQETTEEEQTTAQRKHYDPPVPPETPPKFVATPSYAVSDTHVYGVRSEYNKEDSSWKTTLHYAPLRNIAKQKEISLPPKSDGNPLRDLEIIGLTEQDLFVCHRFADEQDRTAYVTYRVALSNFKATALDTGNYYCAPWYNAGSDSLLFVTHKDGILQIEAMRLNGKERTTVWNEPLEYSIPPEHWRNTADGMVAFERSNDGIPPKERGIELLVIDKDNRAVLTDYAEIDFPADIMNRPQNKMEQSLDGNELISTYATCGEWVYYVEMNAPRNSGEFKRSSLYRMKADSTGKKLLRETTQIHSLMALDNKLFCLAERPTQEEHGDTYPFGFYALDADGKVTETIAQGFDFNGFHYLEPLDHLILYKQWGIYGNNNGYLVFIYDPATGTKFSFGRDDS